MDTLEFKFKYILGLICIAVALVAISWTFYTGMVEDMEYPNLNKSEEFLDQVKSVKAVRTVSRVHFVSGVKRTLGFARNDAYWPSEMCIFLQKDDRIIKRANSDTVRVDRQGIIFVFVLMKEINCCSQDN